jgi:hypothetical protein
MTGLMRIASLLAIASVPTLSAAATANPPPAFNVNVTNTTASPVPVAGNVTVSGSPSVQVVNPVSVKASLTPYVSEVTDSVGGSSGHLGVNGGGVYFAAVPSGKRLLIKHVAVRVVSETKTMLSASLLVPNIPASNTLVEIFLPVPQIVTPHAGALLAYWSIVSQPVEVYVEAGGFPIVDVTLDHADDASVQATLTGYLVDAP